MWPPSDLGLLVAPLTDLLLGLPAPAFAVAPILARLLQAPRCQSPCHKHATSQLSSNAKEKCQKGHISTHSCAHAEDNFLPKGFFSGRRRASTM